MRINFHGGPGSGKSSTAAWLFSELKSRLVSVELVTEYVKSWATQKRQVNGFDQVYLFGKQMQYEYRFLSAGVKNIVTDSPTLLSAIYAEHNSPELRISDYIYEINRQYEKQYPSFNIFLMREDKPYIQEGRYQTLEKAKKLDEHIWEVVWITYPKENILHVSYKDKDTILQEVLKVIDK